MKNPKLFIAEDIPQKSFFKTGELAALLGVKTTEIRFWESQFSELRSHKTRSGKRLYKQEDAILLSAIKHLVNERKFTLAAAKRIIGESDELRSHSAAKSQQPNNLQEVADSPESLVRKDKLPAENKILSDAALMLEPCEEVAFERQSQEIYQEFGTKICAENSKNKEIKDPKENMSVQEKQQKRIKRALEYEQRATALLAQKKALTELLGAISKYGERPFISVN